MISIKISFQNESFQKQFIPVVLPDRNNEGDDDDYGNGNEDDDDNMMIMIIMIMITITMPDSNTLLKHFLNQQDNSLMGQRIFGHVSNNWSICP